MRSASPGKSAGEAASRRESLSASQRRLRLARRLTHGNETKRLSAVTSIFRSILRPLGNSASSW